MLNTIEPIEILGLLAGFLTAFATLPQTLKILKLKDAKAVATGTYLMLVGSYILWLIYGVVVNAISIIFWNIIAIFLGLIVLYLKIFVWNKNSVSPELRVDNKKELK
jgi:MtN3 and saliva related transmembrane protein